MFKAMQLANIWRSNPQGCEHFGITGDLVKQEYDQSAKGLCLEEKEGMMVREMRTVAPIEYPPSKPYAFRAHMQSMARRLGTFKVQSDGGLLSIDGSVWTSPEYV
jgi:hypothetical protein